VLSQTGLAEKAAIPGLCGSDPDGGPAFDAARDVLFVPCKGGGIQEVDLAGDRAGPVLAGSNGAPILVGDRVWAADYGTTAVNEYDATTGRRLQTLDTGTKIPTFASPSVGDGLLLIGTRDGVVAYR
jgi:polyvinyl alcohol dehydrogenase (cytochrome)